MSARGAGRERPAVAGWVRRSRGVLGAVLTLAVAGAVGLGAWQLASRSDPDARARLTIGYHLRATADDGTPLAGVELLAGSQVLATTDERGELSLPLRGRLGAVIALSVRCPPTHVGSPRIPPVALRPHQAVGQPAGAAAPTLEASVRCERTVRRAAVVVRAQLETTAVRRERRARVVDDVQVAPLAATVLLDGAPVARTDAAGIAHLAIERPPGSKLELVVAPERVDGAALPPQAVAFDVAAVDDAYVFDRTFAREVEVAPPPRRIRRARPTAPRAAPIRAVPRGDAPFVDL